jgi:sugar phosphate permease
MLNTASRMGGALGLAVLATLSAARTDRLLGSTVAPHVALTSGYRAAFLVAAACAVLAALLSVPLAAAERQLSAK